MLKIRLQRTGRNQEKTFRLVLTESKNSTKSGKFLEVLGNHDFRVKNGTAINKERVLYWMSKGVKATPTVHNLFLSEKIISGKKINVLPKKTVPKKEEVAEAPKAEVKAEAEAPKAESEAPKAEEPKKEETPAA
jgi:small subunit ribosomal protein S16